MREVDAVRILFRNGIVRQHGATFSILLFPTSMLPCIVKPEADNPPLPAGPRGPGKPRAPCAPGLPGGPCVPFKPRGPCAPSLPGKPRSPLGPRAPILPSLPGLPRSPLGPRAPGLPVKPRGPSTSYPGSLPTPGAAEKTLAGAGHVNTNIFGGKLKIT